MNLKILTLNTQKAYQPGFRDFFIRILKEEKYDFILLQEATAPIVSTVSEIFSEYKVLNPFDPEFGENTHECVVYKNSFTLEKEIFISFAKFGRHDLLRGWGFLAGIFRKDGKTILVGTVHLHPGINREKRLEQVMIIKKEILKHSVGEVIFAGDFNTGLPLEIRGHEKALLPEFVRATKGLGATLDSRYTEKVPFGIARVANFLAFLGISIKLKADHMYVDASTTQKSEITARLLPDRMSDHLAIEVELLA